MKQEWVKSAEETFDAARPTLSSTGRNRIDGALQGH